MKKFISTITLITILFCGLYGQFENPSTGPQQKERKQLPIFFGGNFWLSFGTSTYIEFSPIIGYRVTPKFSTGIGGIYIYEKYHDYYESSNYGGKIFASYALFQNFGEGLNFNLGNIILHAENEVINVQPYGYNFNTGYWEQLNRTWINNLLVGGGIFQPFGQRGSGVYIVVLWNLTEHEYSLDSNPVIRFGFNF